MIGELRREFAMGAIPRWAETPKDVPNPYGLPDAQGLVVLDMGPDMLREGRAVIARILDEVHDQSEDDDSEQIRLIAAWVSLDADGSIGVHVGNSRVGTILAGASTEPVRAAIERWGRDSRTLCADGDLLGGPSPDTARLQLWVATPTVDQATFDASS